MKEYIEFISNCNSSFHNDIYRNAIHIVYSMNGSEVDTVIIRGKIIMEKGQFKSIDEKKVMHEIRSIEKDIKSFQAPKR